MVLLPPKDSQVMSPKGHSGSARAMAQKSKKEKKTSSRFEAGSQGRASAPSGGPEELLQMIGQEMVPVTSIPTNGVVVQVPATPPREVVGQGEEEVPPVLSIEDGGLSVVQGDSERNANQANGHGGETSTPRTPSKFWSFVHTGTGAAVGCGATTGTNHGK